MQFISSHQSTTWVPSCRQRHLYWHGYLKASRWVSLRCRVIQGKLGESPYLPILSSWAASQSRHSGASASCMSCSQPWTSPKFIYHPLLTSILLWLQRRGCHQSKVPNTWRQRHLSWNSFSSQPAAVLFRNSCSEVHAACYDCSCCWCLRYSMPTHSATSFSFWSW